VSGWTGFGYPSTVFTIAERHLTKCTGILKGVTEKVQV
jgi:hypothetical protein